MSLNDKQTRFAEEYIIDLNATQAAKRAGYSENTAGSMGYENLTKPEIHAYIQELIKERSQRTEIKADFVLSGLKEVAQRCMQKRPVMEWNYEEKQMEQVQDSEGRDVWTFDSTGANRSLELLGRHLGLFEKDNQQKGVKIRVTRK